jgi:tetratricopeptide (TPR) repeat protein
MRSPTPQRSVPPGAARSAGGGRARGALVAALLALVTVLPYWQVRGHDFVNYDDPMYVTANPRVQSGLGVEQARWAFTTLHGGNWHPLTWLSHMLDCELFGVRPGPAHLVSVALHAASTLLLYAFLTRATGARWPSAFVAALFGVHPLHVESVAWLAERKDVLSGLFCMLTLWAYARFVERPSTRRYVAVATCLLLGLMAKSMLVTLPFVLLLLDYWPFRRFGAAGDGARLVLEKAPLVAIAATFAALAVVAQRRGGSMTGLGALSAWSRIAHAAVAYVQYVGQTLWPSRLAAFYPFPETIPAWQAATAIALVLAVSALVVRAASRRPYLAVGWLWYLGTLAPVIGLVQVGMQATADRYTYLPLIGLWIMGAWAAADWVRRVPRARTAVAALAALAIAACVVTTWRQVGYWRDSVTLFRHALAVTADNFVAHNNLGLALVARGEIGEATTHFAEAVRLKPSDPDARSNLGGALYKQGRVDEAIANIRELLRRYPDYAPAHNNLGTILYAQGHVDEAIAEYETTLRLQPDHVDARRSLNAARTRRDRGVAVP